MTIEEDYQTCDTCNNIASDFYCKEKSNLIERKNEILNKLKRNKDLSGKDIKLYLNIIKEINI